MSKLIVAFGPSASGKTTAAEAWKWADPDHRLVIDEGDFHPSVIDKYIKPQLDAGNDVWMNILLNEHATLSIELDGYEVEMRKFERRADI
jgi:hypothetical protein